MVVVGIVVVVREPQDLANSCLGSQIDNRAVPSLCCLRPHSLLCSLDRARRAPASSTAAAAGEAGDDNVKDGNDSVDDGLEDGADAVDDGHEGSADCAEHAGDLDMTSQGDVSLGQEAVLCSQDRTYAGDDSTHDCRFTK